MSAYDEDLEEETVEDKLDAAMEFEDFGFIITATGDIKAVFMPDTYDSLPDNVQKIFTMFGVSPQLMAYNTSSMIH